MSALACTYISLADGSAHSVCIAALFGGAISSCGIPVIDSSTYNSGGVQIDFGHDLAFLAYRYPPNEEYWYSPSG